MTQPQLFAVSLREKDVVYTPDDVARDVVKFFKPTGKILEPCAGDGAFLKWLPPDTEWCEIEKGRDFFAEHRHFDWIVGNPPYSVFFEWLRHSFELADDIVYLMFPYSLFNSTTRLRPIMEWGGIKTLYILGSSKETGMANFGYLVAAVHFQRGYRGGTFTVFRQHGALREEIKKALEK